MYLCYRDEIGIVKAEVDGTINFVDGFAFFTVDDKEYRIRVNQIIAIDRIRGGN